MECNYEIEIIGPKAKDKLFKPYVKFRFVQLNTSIDCMTDQEVDNQIDQLIYKIEELRKQVKKKLKSGKLNHKKIIEDKMKKIACVRINLDDNVPNYMSGIIRAGSVISEDENGSEISDHQELIDNTEYHSREELLEDIARRLKVDVSICEILK